MDEPNEILENAIAQLQLIAYNGGLVSLSDDEALAIVHELDRLYNCERAHKALLRDYDGLVLDIDLEYDEMADLITELHQAAQAMAEYIALVWEHDPENEPAFMPGARAAIANAERFIAYYHRHMK